MKKNGAVQSQSQLWSDYLLCVSCEKAFNHSTRCPVSLVCGHTVCKSCLGKNKHAACQGAPSATSCDVTHLPVNSALLQLVPPDTGHQKENHAHANAILSPSVVDSSNPLNFGQCMKHYESAKEHIESLALYLKPSNANDLTRPMQRKLVALVNCQPVEEEGRKRATRAARALGERTATELILLHQNPSTLSASLWTAVRGRGCQFLGPAMQEEALKLVHLALEDRTELARKVLVQLVVKKLRTQFTQASKTSIGHVVQLLYRASCFKVTKREGDSSLMRLKDEFLHYDDLRKEHDTQIVQIAREAGLRIAPDQWSALLYGDQVHKSYMQSIIDKLQSGVTFQQSIQDLSLAISRSGDPGNIQLLIPAFKFLSQIDVENPSADWVMLVESMRCAKMVVQELVNFSKKHHHSMWQNQDSTQQSSKYKTSLCRDFKNKGICPRGATCTFAHSDHELQFHRNRRKKGGQNALMQNNYAEESVEFGGVEATDNVYQFPSTEGIKNTCSHTCNCSMAQTYANTQSPSYQVTPAPRRQESIQSQSLYKESAPSGQNTHTNQQVPPIYAPVPVQQPTVPIQAPRPVIAHQPPPPVQPHRMRYRQVTPVAPRAMAIVPSENMASTAIMHDPPNQYYPQNFPPGTVHFVPDSQNVPRNQSVQPQQMVHHYAPQHAPIHQPPPSQPQQQQQQHHQQQHQYVVRPHYLPVQRQAPRQDLIQPVFIPHPSTPVQEVMHGVNVMQGVPPQQGMYVEPSAQVQPEYRVIQPTVTTIAPTVQLNPSNVTFTINHARSASPTSADTCSLEELRQRKMEVINKLVQKRIVTPKSTASQQQSFRVYPVESEVNSSTDMEAKSHQIMAGLPSGESLGYNKGTVGLSFQTTPVAAPGHATSKGYSLWSGTTCITSLYRNGPSEVSYDSPSQPSSMINVMSDHDTSTSHVTASGWYSRDLYSSPSAQTPSPTPEDLRSLTTTDDDFYPIQDQRIVSKYGPIARTVKSRTTPAIPEQVTANANSFTQPFASDINRNRSKFVVNPSMEQQSVPCVCTEVEPTVTERPPTQKRTIRLPDLLVNSQHGQMPLVDNVLLDQAIPRNMQSEMKDETEDLLLAIELQQIEMGIQQKLITQKTNTSN